MESKWPDETLRKCKRMRIHTVCPRSKAFSAWRGPIHMIVYLKWKSYLRLGSGVANKGNETQCAKTYLLICALNEDRSACTSVQSDQSSLFAWRNVATLPIKKAPNDDFDQTTQRRRLIWIFAGRTCLKARFLTLRLKMLCYNKTASWDTIIHEVRYQEINTVV